MGMRGVQFISLFIGLWWTASAGLTRKEKDLLGEVFEICDGVKTWSTFSTQSQFEKTISRGGVIYKREWEDTVAQFKKETGGNYAAYVKARREDTRTTYFDAERKTSMDTRNWLRLEMLQGGDFLLRVEDASDAYFGNEMRQFGPNWFRPSDIDFRGRLPSGGEFADHVSISLGKPANLREAVLESVEEIDNKEIDTVVARCIQAKFKSYKGDDSKSRSITFCFSDGRLMEITEKIDSKPDRLGDPDATEIHSTAVRSYVAINGAVNFPFQPSPFPVQKAGKQYHPPLLQKLAVRKFGVYFAAFGVMLVMFVAAMFLKRKASVPSEREPLLGANNEGASQSQAPLLA